MGFLPVLRLSTRDVIHDVCLTFFSARPTPAPKPRIVKGVYE